ncbi:MAG TPA: hypothetical protein PKY30_19425, partial [Myxococcota bacterium]|nr:hypothetical protein [Myxococcota bacterium]
AEGKVVAMLGGLSEATAYHFRLVVEYSSNTSPDRLQKAADDRAFTTLPDSSVLPRLYVGQSCLVTARPDGTHAYPISGAEEQVVGMALHDGALYYVHYAGVFRWTVGGASPERLCQLPGDAGVIGLAIDENAGQIYLISLSRNRLLRLELNGSGLTDLGNPGGILNGPIAIALDSADPRMYILNRGNNRVIRARLDGTESEDLGDLGGSLDQGTGIALDRVARRMYVCTGSKVLWANLDGSDARDLGNLNNTLSQARGIAWDPQAGQIYVANYGDGSVSRADFDGSNGIKIAVSPGNRTAQSIAIAPDPRVGPAVLDRVWTQTDGQWFPLATEGQRVLLPCATTVRYGTDGAWIVRSASASTYLLCDPSFSRVDPAPGRPKRLELKLPALITQPSGTWATFACLEGAGYYLPTPQILRYSWRPNPPEWQAGESLLDAARMKVALGEGRISAEAFEDPTRNSTSP